MYCVCKLHLNLGLFHANLIPEEADWLFPFFSIGGSAFFCIWFSIKLDFCVLIWNIFSSALHSPWPSISKSPSSFHSWDNSYSLNVFKCVGNQCGNLVESQIHRLIYLGPLSDIPNNYHESSMFWWTFQSYCAPKGVGIAKPQRTEWEMWNRSSKTPKCQIW